jgi:hypothetical protein
MHWDIGEVRAYLGIAYYFAKAVRAISWEKVLVRLKWRKRTKPAPKLPVSQPTYPADLVRAVQREFPEYRLPEAADITGDWAQYADGTGKPFFATGRFTQRRHNEHVIFLLPDSPARGYKVVAFIRSHGELVPFQLANDENRSGRYEFLERLPPGRYAPGRVTRKHGARTVRVSHDAVAFGTYEASSSVIYWDKKQQRFQQQWMSD